VCRHVLEHVEDPRAFLGSIRAALGERDAGIYLEVPNGGFMLSAAGVWDYIYPHVTYFSPAGLNQVLTDAGFQVTATGTAFGDQFLWAEARTGPAPVRRPLADPAADQRYIEAGRGFREVY